MKIRSITYFCNPGWPLDEKVLRQAGEFLSKAKTAYEAAGYEVQTKRLATIPFPTLLGENRINELPVLAKELDQLIEDVDIGYGSLGPALPDMLRKGELQTSPYAIIPEAIAVTKNVFFSGIMADKSVGIDLAAVRACADVIVKCGPLDPRPDPTHGVEPGQGFANLRFAALANVNPGSPFFPAAYHEGDTPAFAIATEAADLAVDAFSEHKTVDEGRTALIAEIEKHGKALAGVASRELGGVTRESGIGNRTTPDSRFPAFLGIDFSLAPFPAEAQSLGTAFERLGVPAIGLHGSLAAAAILTEAIDRADFPRTGFSGLMMPVLEDTTLALRAAEGWAKHASPLLTIKDLLLYSAVCGTGLDTIPLPGDTTAEQIVPLLLDLCALALRLDKPLTARLMPVPGKRAGDATAFDFGFFANSKVMVLEAQELKGVLAGREVFSLRSRK